jgi:hypothetical protein
MKIKKLMIAMLMLATLIITPAAAFNATAYWTGKVKYVTTVTYQQGVSCEYSYAGTLFWKTFVASSCPVSVEIQ